MKNLDRVLYVWSEKGYVFCMEEGDYTPMDMDTHIYESDANDYLNMEINELQKSGYEIKVGRPSYLQDGWNERQ